MCAASGLALQVQYYDRAIESSQEEEINNAKQKRLHSVTHCK